VLQLLGRLACAGAGTLNGRGPISASVAGFTCSHCDKPGAKFSQDVIWDDPESYQLFNSLIAVLSLRGFQKCTEARIVAMLALRRIVLHCANRIDGLANTEYGEWCLQSLRSSVRELRIAAG